MKIPLWIKVGIRVTVWLPCRVVTKEIRDTHYASNIMFSGLKLILYTVD